WLGLQDAFDEDLVRLHFRHQPRIFEHLLTQSRAAPTGQDDGDLILGLHEPLDELPDLVLVIGDSRNRQAVDRERRASLPGRTLWLERDVPLELALDDLVPRCELTP